MYENVIILVCIFCEKVIVVENKFKMHKMLLYIYKTLVNIFKLECMFLLPFCARNILESHKLSILSITHNFIYMFYSIEY